jgi:hypothetical protein
MLVRKSSKGNPSDGRSRMNAPPREQALGKLQKERRNSFAAVVRVERATQTYLTAKHGIIRAT